MSVLDLCLYPAMSIFAPVSSVIQSITQGPITTITTYTPHNLISGTIIRITISPNCGMPQINQQTAQITVTGPSTLTIPLDSTLYWPFVIPTSISNPDIPPPGQQPCSFVVPIGENSLMLSAAVQNILP